MDWLEGEVANAKDEMMSSLNLLDHDRAQIKSIPLLKSSTKAKE